MYHYGLACVPRSLDCGQLLAVIGLLIWHPIRALTYGWFGAIVADAIGTAVGIAGVIAGVIGADAVDGASIL